MDEPLLLTVKQTAERLSLGRSFTYRLIQTGQLRSVRIGGSRRILLSDLNEFVTKLEADGEADE